MTPETQRIKGEITVQFPFLLRDVNGKEIDRYRTMSDAQYGAVGLADGWIVIVQEHLFEPIPGYWGMFEEKMCGVCGLLKSRHDTFVSQEVFQVGKERATEMSQDQRRAWALGYQEGVMASRPTVDPLRNSGDRNPFKGTDSEPEDIDSYEVGFKFLELDHDSQVLVVTLIDKLLALEGKSG